jgi:hypothetical protein
MNMKNLRAGHLLAAAIIAGVTTLVASQQPAPGNAI